MKCAWCQKEEVTDERLYFQILGFRFALCPFCSSTTFNLLTVINYLAKVTKRDNVAPIQKRKAA